MADPNTTALQKLRDGDYINAWRQLKEENPVAYAAATVLPVTGQAAAIADYADAMDRGDSLGGAMAAASFVPATKLLQFGGKAISAAARYGMSKAQQPPRPAAPQATAAKDDYEQAWGQAL